MKSWRLPHITGSLRIGLWILLLLLTSLIFLYPTDLHYRYAPIDSIYVFSNLPLFGALYYVWFALILILLLFPSGKQGSRDWENVGLLAIFTLVFSGIWVTLTHGYYGEVFNYATPMKFALAESRMPSYIPYFGYIEFPGLHLLGAATVQITGLRIFDTITLLLLLQSVLLFTLSYLLFKNSFNDTRLASIATLIVITGSLDIARILPIFHARGLALIFLAAFLLTVSKEKPVFNKSPELILLSLIILLATIVTHAVTSFVFLLIFLGMYLVQRFAKSNLVSISLLTLSLVFFFTYQMYLSVHAFGNLSNLATIGVKNVFGGEFLSAWTAQVISKNVAGSWPLWAAITRYFWGVVVLFGAILGLRNLLRIKRVPSVEVKEAGGLVGAGSFTVMTSLLSGGAEAIGRFLYYIPFFAVPAVLRFVSGLGGSRLKRLPLAILAVLLFALSFPTFLVHHNLVSTATYYPSEVNSLQFIGSQADETEAFVNEQNATMVNYYLPYARPNVVYFYGVPAVTEEAWLKEINNWVMGFKRSDDAWLIFSERCQNILRHQFGTDPTTTPQWREMMDRLDEENLIYSNGFVQLYRAGGGGQ
jgi:hypothetical protein